MIILWAGKIEGGVWLRSGLVRWDSPRNRASVMLHGSALSGKRLCITRVNFPSENKLPKENPRMILICDEIVALVGTFHVSVSCIYLCMYICMYTDSACIFMYVHAQMLCFKPRFSKA